MKKNKTHQHGTALREITLSFRPRKDIVYDMKRYSLRQVNHRLTIRSKSNTFCLLSQLKAVNKITYQNQINKICLHVFVRNLYSAPLHGTEANFSGIPNWSASCRPNSSVPSQNSYQRLTLRKARVHLHNLQSCQVYFLLQRKTFIFITRYFFTKTQNQETIQRYLQIFSLQCL